MQPAHWRAHARLKYLLSSAAGLGLVGCASPGPPKPPSLHLPRPVTQVTAVRTGDEVTLQFQVPALSTDGQPLRDPYLQGSLCRQLGNSGPCQPVDVQQTRSPLPVGRTAPVIWTDTLPASLSGGARRELGYRIELRTSSGRSAGPSDPIFAAAGTAPSPVSDLRADPMRLGIALHWVASPGNGEVLLDRSGPPPASDTGSASREAAEGKTGVARSATQPNGKRGKGRGIKASRTSGTGSSKARPAAPVILQAAPGNESSSYTVDATAAEGTTYTYSAYREQTVKLGGRTLQLRSTSSALVTATWHDIYPPARPVDLTALGYRVPASESQEKAGQEPAFAVDLIWSPVNDTRLAGYRVYRQSLNAAGNPVGSRELLQPDPVTTPGFHDAGALASGRYRYTVTAIDPKGNESTPARADVTPATSPR